MYTAYIKTHIVDIYKYVYTYIYIYTYMYETVTYTTHKGTNLEASRRSLV